MNEQFDPGAVELTIANRENEIVSFINTVPVVARIENQTHYTTINDMAKKVREKRLELDNERKNLTGPLDRIKKFLNDGFFRPIQKLQELELKLINSMTEYNAEQEQKRLQIQREKEEEAERQKKIIEDEALKEREKADKLRKQAQDADNEFKRERLNTMADRHEDNADAKENIAEQVVAAPTKDRKKLRQGVYTVKSYEIVVQDADAFIKFCAINKRSTYLTINEKVLKAEVEATSGKIEWPGIRVRENKESRMRK